MSTPPKTKAEILAAIEQIKQLDQDRLEALRNLRRVADALIASPATTPEEITSIERDFESLQQLNDSVNVRMKQLADRYFETDVDQLLANCEGKP